MCIAMILSENFSQVFITRWFARVDDAPLVGF